MKRSALTLSFIISYLAFSPAGALAQAVDKADVTLSFSTTQEGHRFSPIWGLDQAWINEQNLLKGINHMGKENVGVGRTAFRFSEALVNDSALSANTIKVLQQRSNTFNKVSSSLPLLFTADQEPGADEYFVKNKQCNTQHWAAMINSHVHWMQKYTRHPIIGVSPYNEPDYWSVEEGATPDKQWQVAKMLKEQYPRMDTIAMVGGNTLNDDMAMKWYSGGKQWYDWGNTHQLAGSFDNFANFFQQLKQDGKVGYADEMHNVAEAMVGLEYGMTVGVWWGFDSRARGEFCQFSSHGERLVYGEHRNNWTAASVYRHDDGRVKAFVGSSERQAYTTTYQFVVTDRDVYFDGEGPLRQWRMEMPGGTGYQKGQTNGERVVDITWGEDVPTEPVATGTYKLVNKATGNVLALQNGNIVQQKDKGAKTQLWNVSPSNPRKTGGDFSFFDFLSASDGKTRINLLNFSTQDQAEIIAYSQNENPSSNEQWYLEYYADGFYFVRNRESALYLTSKSGSATEGAGIYQRKLQTSDALRNRQLWRLLPSDASYDVVAPAQPSGLTATTQSASVLLTWEKNSEEDLNGYLVLRAEANGGNGNDELQWNTIARRVMPPYVDNTCMPAHTYLYKVQAIDLAQNRSVASTAAQVTTSDDKALVARWTMDGTTNDATENLRHAAASTAAPTYVEGYKEGTQAINLQKQYVQLPYSVVQGNELTVAMWVNLRNNGQWQRLFDFGLDTGHYLFLTPVSGDNKMRLAIKNGGAEQTLDAPRITALKWKHIVVTMKPGSTAIYIDGEQAAQTDGITISPNDVCPLLNYIGRSQFNSDPLLQAFIADVRIYYRALPATEVQQLFSGTDAISLPEATGTAAPAIYSLDGKRLQQPQRGINIVDGKKVMGQ